MATLALLLAAAPLSAQTRSVAITFDDLPGLYVKIEICVQPDVED